MQIKVQFNMSTEFIGKKKTKPKNPPHKANNFASIWGRTLRSHYPVPAQLTGKNHLQDFRSDRKVPIHR